MAQKLPFCGLLWYYVPGGQQKGFAHVLCMHAWPLPFSHSVQDEKNGELICNATVIISAAIIPKRPQTHYRELVCSDSGSVLVYTVTVSPLHAALNLLVSVVVFINCKFAANCFHVLPSFLRCNFCTDCFRCPTKATARPPPRPPTTTKETFYSPMDCPRERRRDNCPCGHLFSPSNHNIPIPSLASSSSCYHGGI